MPGAHEPEELIGKVLDNRYRLLEMLGEGGMGTVYRAEHIVLGEQVAIKLLGPRFAYDREWVQRFLVEARAARRIQHPHIVRIVDVAIAGPGLVYMVMELIAGETLSALVRREGPLPWPRALAIALQVAAALGAAHASGVVHRDIKPANCIVQQDPSGADQIKVLDFGIAKFTEARDRASTPQTVTGMWMGTAEYMAPEMFRGEPAGPGMDIYAVGVLLYKLLTGVTPFRGEHIEVATQLAQRDAVPPSRLVPLPAAVDAVVLRALARDAAARTPSMAALTAELAAVLAQPPAPVPAPSPTAATPEPARLVGPTEESPSTEPSVISTFVDRNMLQLLVGSALLGLALVVMLIASLAGLGDAPPPVAAAPEPTPAAEPTPPPAPPPVVPEPPPPAPPPEPEPEPTVDPAARARPGEPAKKKPTKKRSAQLPEALSDAAIRSELIAMNRTIQDKCFKANRAVSGTRVTMDVKVDPAGKATTRLAAAKYATFGTCIDYWLRRKTFPTSRTGGQIQHVFFAE